MLKYVLALLLITFSGCSNFNFQTDGPKFLLPLNLAAGYFGTVAVHEGGHAAAGVALGGDQLEVDMLPAKDDDGNFHLALTTIRVPDSWSKTDESLFLSMGPTASFLAHVSSRELLKSGYVPNELQSTLAWFSLCNSVSYYFHVASGLARIESSDMGKQDAWISGVMLVGAMTYDLYDILSDNGNYLNVLIGEGFYEPNDKRYRLLSQVFPDGGGFLGLEIGF